MQRVIKFRAWDGNKMLITDFWLNCFGISCNDKTPRESSLDCILMQFTGVPDNKGAEIYEDDIVKITWLADVGITEFDCEAIGVVKYDTDFAAFYAVFIKPYKRSVPIDSESSGTYEVEEMQIQKSDEEGISFEIIGNIHQNPELLTSPTS